jgi:hypothetical protein
MQPLEYKTIVRRSMEWLSVRMDGQVFVAVLFDAMMFFS